MTRRAGAVIKTGLRESGGIGRRTRFRLWRCTPWGFKSPLSHQGPERRFAPFATTGFSETAGFAVGFFVFTGFFDLAGFFGLVCFFDLDACLEDNFFAGVRLDVALVFAIDYSSIQSTHSHFVKC